MKTAKKFQLATITGNDIYDVVIKKGMRFILLEANKTAGAKKGDIVKMTSVTSVFRGVPSDGRYNDYELLRVSNGRWSWRVSRSALRDFSDEKNFK
jgi:hypothetical protein